jgi:DnaJ family protein C protein 17
MTSTFGPVDGDSIVLSMKPPKKKASAAAAAAATEQKPAPPKYAIAAVPFKTIADAHAAVCASRRADRGLDEFEISWMGGCEPAVWSWAERMLKLKEERGATVPATPAPADGARDVGDDAPASGLSPDSGASSSPATGAQFSSFPSSFVGSHILSSLLCFADSPDHHPKQSGPPPPLSSAPRFSAPGLDFESAVLMRMRQAERERLEREIREQEASET